ncbi:MAG: hypothetical protein V4484_00640 [Pseudomonadota bacterium]
MKKRGKILRDTSAGAGLLMIEGKQMPFTLEGMWQSEHAPRIGMTVEVQFDDSDAITSLQPVPDTQLAREQSEAALNAARAKGGELASGIVARVGMPTLIGLAMLAAAWFVLNTVAVNVGPGFRTGLSFWKLLGALNSPAGALAGLNGASDGAGIYGLFTVLALLAPAAPQFWQDRRAHLGALMPLLWMLLVAFIAYQSIGDAVSASRGAAASFGGAQAAEMIASMQQNMMREAMRAISLGLGFYLAVATSLYFAVTGAIRYMAARA